MTKMALLGLIMFSWLSDSVAKAEEFELSKTVVNYNVASLCKNFGQLHGRSDILSASKNVIAQEASGIFYELNTKGLAILDTVPDLASIKAEMNLLTNQNSEIISGYIVGYLAAIADTASEELIKIRGVSSVLKQCVSFLSEKPYGFEFDQ